LVADAAEFRVHRSTKRHRNGPREEFTWPRVVPREANAGRHRLLGNQVLSDVVPPIRVICRLASV
jgi:hypothetical protein